MQTFLPYPDFRKTAQCLDYKRLGKQRVEAWQILQCLKGVGSLRWKNHPAVKMWKGFETVLAHYGYEMCGEWLRRGYKDSLSIKFFSYSLSKAEIKVPYWLGDEKFHSAHRSNLLRKDYGYYSKFDWKETDDMPYYWPVK